MNFLQTSNRRSTGPADMLARDAQISLDDLLQDPLTRLVMASDGVTEEDMIVLFNQLQQSLTSRQSAMTEAIGEAGMKSAPELGIT